MGGTMIDTIRILLGWKCNLSCPYCCNNIPSVRKSIRRTTLRQIDWNKYQTVCITGGEPLLNTPWLYTVLLAIPKGKFIVINTNGILLRRRLALRLHMAGVNVLNIGLHDPNTFDKLIKNAEWVTMNTDIRLRFNVEDIYNTEFMNLEQQYPNTEFVYWHRDACERNNEDRVIITN
jgi:molybdenum cofactor biosynthesis enzyme MoaA